MLSKICLDDRRIGCFEGGLSASINRTTAHAVERFGQFFVGDIPIQIDGGVVEQLDLAVNQGIHVVVAGGFVQHQIQHVVFSRFHLRNGIRLLEAGMTRLGNGGKVFHFDTQCRLLQSFDTGNLVFIVSHVLVSSCSGFTIQKLRRALRRYPQG